MIVGWHVECDSCGAVSDELAEGTGMGNMPPGWLHGHVSLYDRNGKEGVTHGHVCPMCAGLPVRDLIAQHQSYRAGKAAVLA